MFRRYNCALLLILLLAAGIHAQDVPYLGRNIQPLSVGSPIPDLELTDMNHQPIRLHDLVDLSPILLIYYRGGW